MTRNHEYRYAMHHIDGNPRNNDPSNLRIVDTWKHFDALDEEEEDEEEEERLSEGNPEEYGSST